MRKFLLMCLFPLLLVGCTSAIDDSYTIDHKGNDKILKIHAVTEPGSIPDTKVYADNQFRVLWNSGDLLSIFNFNTYNSKFQFDGNDGDNAGDFSDITPSGIHTSNPLNKIYAVYPYAKENKINNDGNVITITFPQEQNFREHSFGIGANAMVAVSDNGFLAFKNIGGYLSFRLYGDNVTVNRISIQGKNGEKLSGAANVEVGMGTVPTVTMLESANETVSIVCDPPVTIGSSSSDYTDFWFVLPPLTFSNGFTLTVTDNNGDVFEKSTSMNLSIKRSTLDWINALKVVPIPVSPNNENPSSPTISVQTVSATPGQEQKTISTNTYHAVVNGSLSVVGCEYTATRYFLYSKSYDTLDDLKVGGSLVNADESFSVKITGLQENTKYYYVAAAEVTVGTTKEKYYGSVKTFTTPSYQTPAYVDMDLSSGIKWGTKNLGASTPAGEGTKGSWGYNLDTRNRDPQFQSGDNLLLSEDRAHNNLGGYWRTPTYTEWQELLSNCDITKTNDGLIIKSKKHSSHQILIPLVAYWTATCARPGYTPSGSSGWMFPMAWVIDSYTLNPENGHDYVKFSTGAVDGTSGYMTRTIRPVYVDR